MSSPNPTGSAQDEARRALADKIAFVAECDLRECARDLMVGIPVEPQDLRGWADLMDEAVAALRARPERAEEAMREPLADALAATADCGGVDMKASLGELVAANLPLILAALRAQPVRATEPPPGLLMSMAIRYDHGLAMPGYYDQEIFKLTGGATHAQRLESTLSTMRQLWEEATGNGFYRPHLEESYAAQIARLGALPLTDDEGGGE